MDDVSEVIFSGLLCAMAARLGWLCCELAQQLWQKYSKRRTDN